MKRLITIMLLIPVMALAQSDSLFTAADKQINPQFDGASIELGTVFKSAKAGKVTHLKFWKTVATDAAQYTVSLWTISGQKLAFKNYTANGSSGWQRVALDVPVPINANQNYVVSVAAPTGRYPEMNDFYTVSRVRGNLTAPAGTTSVPNGRFKRGSGFPATAFLNSNYGLDVVVSYVTKQPLVINAGTDTVLYTPVDQAYALDYKLNGSVSGDGVQVTWVKLDSAFMDSVVVLKDTMFNRASATPILSRLSVGYYVYELHAKDMYGDTAIAQVGVSVIPNPKSTFARVIVANNTSVRLLYDGTTIAQDGTIGVWRMEGFNLKGFDVDETTSIKNQ